MADLAVGAVTKLLGLIHNETLLLGRVKDDVWFIKEEMESINSFLSRLTRMGSSTTGMDTKEHEQIRTWMKQVRDLAHDCSNCIDLYLQRGDPMIHRARGGVLGYLWWVPWIPRKVIEHFAASELSKLKERARDVSERRSRYDVKVPEEIGGGVAGLSHAPLSALAGGEDDDDDDDDDIFQNRAVALAGKAGQRRRALEPRFLEDYCAEKLSTWLKLRQEEDQHGAKRWTMPSITIVAPDVDSSGDMAREALDLVPFQFDRQVWINLQQVKASWSLPLLPEELLCYILQECELKDKGEIVQDHLTRSSVYTSNVIYQTMDMIEEYHFYGKIEEINSKIGQLESKWSKYISDKHFAMLYQALNALQIGPDMGMYMSLLSREEIMLDAASMLKYHMESAIPKDKPQILLDIAQYKDILDKVFLASNKEASTSAAPPPPTLGEDVIREIIHIVRDLLPKPQQSEGKSSEKEQPVVDTTGMNDATATEIEEARQKIYMMYMEFKYQLLLKVIADKINTMYLKDKKTLIVLQDDGDYISNWEETRNALSLIGCTLGSAVIVTTKKSQRAKEFCYPPGEPITYSLVGLYYDIALELTREKTKRQDGSYDPKILHDVLDICSPHEFAMKVFVRDLYANPTRSGEDLKKLLDDLDLQRSLEGSSNYNFANMTMLKFSYNSLPKEYKTCLVYLAIFPPAHKINRSTLIGRWVVEGLITKGNWASAVHHGERCFDMLIDKWLVIPKETGATGKIKSCIVGDQVHEFVTRIAKKEHILDPRLSHVWARHFSVFSDLRLGASDSIKKLMQKIHKYSPQLQLLMVLDLEGCKFPIEKIYLSNICSNILRLKYLSLRGTEVANLPREVNNLSELEILDIRQTNVCADTTHILLPKLKRLLASPSHPSPMCTSTAHIPSNIKKMINMEVLSNVMASWGGNELQDIRKLWQLKKLGVVIEDKEVHLEKLLRVVSDLKDSIKSLSITLHTVKREGTSSSTKELLLADKVCRRLEQESKRLESLTINGATNRVKLLSLLTKGGDRLAKVTLNNILLNDDNLKDLADLPKLCCVRLRNEAYIDSSRKLIFKEHDFQHLKYFLVDGLQTTDIIEFENGKTPELRKIALSFTSIKCLCGAGGLPKLKELELKGNKFLVSLLKDEAALDDKQCNEGVLAFRKDEFQHLEHLLVDAELDTNIFFEDGAATVLRKIILFLKNIRSVHGISSLPRLAELELTGDNRSILLSLLDEKIDRIAKVTLRDTLLKQDDLQVLAKKPILRCLELLGNSYVESELIFNKDEFPKLTLLIVNSPTINSIIFADGAAPKMEKITWTFSRMESLTGIKNLPKLNRLEFIGHHVPYQVREDIKAHRMCIVYTHRVTVQHENQAMDQGAEDDLDDDIASFPFSSCIPSKNWCIGSNSP
uniref:Uncharacterized protein n=1 Tax=Leersia perrieri TaxID=77586 RepID=A0A0D9XUQ1_9ORYZ